MQLPALATCTCSQPAMQTPRLSTGGCVLPPTMQRTLGTSSLRSFFCPARSGGECMCCRCGDPRAPYYAFEDNQSNYYSISHIRTMNCACVQSQLMGCHAWGGVKSVQRAHVAATLHQFGGSISRTSISNRRLPSGGMPQAGKPPAPYASAAGISSFLLPPTFMPKQP